jgi:putative SOS response-associated peptidase YedK
MPAARGRLQPRYNIAPTQPVACVRRPADSASDTTATDMREDDARAGNQSNDTAARELVPMRWGLIPFWA